MTAYEPCEECGAPLDAQQRYCVECGARRGNGANPASRYFAAMSKRARRPPAGPPQRPPASRAAAVGFFALLPIAVALGLVVGRSGSDSGSEAALLRALRSSEAQATASAGTTAEQPTATAKTKPKSKQAKKGPKKSKAAKKSESEGGKTLEKTKNGTVHQVAGYKPTKKKEEEDTKLVEENPEQTGQNYIRAQQHLPDVIVVGGGGGGGGETSKPGAEP
ncbi:MAG: hypothetical protein JST31_11385 [Actinobacteria bacterium]|nr:hypothetical protein [Actinomycetota bacterium]